MAISKITLNGVTQMDVTQKTVTAGKMLNNVTALKNDGTDITGNIATKTAADMTANGATVTAPAGHYASDASKAVASGTAGTPTATKGPVSNHAVTVTPSVTNTTGYIEGGTKTGTGVSVAASELVSGLQTLSRNGSFDVTNLAEIVTRFPDAFDFESGTFSPDSDVVTYNIPFTRTHSRMPFFAMVVDATGTYDSTQNTSAYMCYHNYLQSWNALFKMASSTNVYGFTHIAYRTTNGSTLIFNQYPFYYSYTNTGTSNQNYPRYWVTETGIKATTISTAYWRAGRTYRWFAIWNSPVDPAWEIGAIATNSGANYDATNRMRTAEYIPVNSSVYVSLKNGARVTLIGLNSSLQFVESTSWISSSFNLAQQVSSMTNASNIAYVKLMASYSDNADITDIDDLIADVEITGMT